MAKKSYTITVVSLPFGGHQKGKWSGLDIGWILDAQKLVNWFNWEFVFRINKMLI